MNNSRNHLKLIKGTKDETEKLAKERLLKKIAIFDKIVYNEFLAILKNPVANIYDDNAWDALTDEQMTILKPHFKKFVSAVIIRTRYIKRLGLTEYLSMHSYSNEEHLKILFMQIEIINIVLNNYFSPIEIWQMFPPKKVYDGEKYQTKDYFSSINIIKEEDRNKFLKDISYLAETNENNSVNFLWDTYNETIFCYILYVMNIVDKIRKIEGKCSCIEEFLGDNDIKPMPIVKDNLGQKLLIDENGKCHKITPAKKKSHLKLIK